MVVFAALLSHYRRHPWQGLSLVVLLVVASALWSGIHHLTGLARASLETSEQAVAERQQLVREDGVPVSVDDYVRLRRQGLCIQPWLEVLPEGQAQRVVGVDPLAATCLPGQAELESFEGQALDGRPFLDIADAAAMAADQQRLSLILPDGDITLPDGYRQVPFSLAPDTGELGDSFLLNLDALSVLVLLIAALLLRSVYQLSEAQRRESLELLQRYGVTATRLRTVRMAELLVLAAIALLPGLWLGQLLADTFASGFGRALDNLFGAPQLATEPPSWGVPAAVMTATLFVACLADQWFPVHRVSQRAWQVLALAAGVTGVALVVFAPSLLLMFVGLTLVLGATGVWAPWLIAGVANRAGRVCRSPLARWWWGEVAVLARRLALPLVALQFALATVLAVQALVVTFEDTFDRWLAQRLAADYYVAVPPGADAEAAGRWLASKKLEQAGGAWHRVARGSARMMLENDAQAVDVFALSPIGPLVQGWSLLASVEAPWQQLANGQGVMINEQLAYRHGVSVGDRLILALAGSPSPSEPSQYPVLAIYPDYGRPAGEVLLPLESLPAETERSFESLSIAPGDRELEPIREGLRNLWAVPSLEVQDNLSIKDIADRIFDQTFALTRAMTVLTLVLATLSLLLMAWVFLGTRLWYFRLLEVWGLARQQVFRLLSLLALSLCLMSALLALPLGVGLTWVLVQRINPLAFGWSLPMAVYPGFWLNLLGLALLAGAGVAMLMKRRLRQPGAKPSLASAAGGGER
ncbi:MAG: FtsX-like permease family protein [Pseudomonadota bacterium]|nr:FtsX-like permease family protein [Pseudomonadota bacterium]